MDRHRAALRVLALAAAPVVFAGGASAQIENTATVETSTPGLSNFAFVIATTSDPAFSNNFLDVTTHVIDTATVVSTVVAEADLELSKTVDPAAVTAGEQVTYHLEVENLGPSTAQDVTITDPLPPQVTFVSLTASPGGSCATPAVGSSGTVSCSWVGATGPAEVRSVDVVVQVAPGTPSSTVENSATASSPTTDPEPDNDGAAADVLVTALSVLEVPALSPAAALLLTVLLAAGGLLALRRAFPGA
jgi:uncharacterized repeat protein (TIGR01451 family)